MIRKTRRPDIGPMPPQFEALATYNAEVYRGIVHTQEYDAFMAELQRRYDEWQAPSGHECGCPAADGVIRHQRGTCTDPAVAGLDWYADRGGNGDG